MRIGNKVGVSGLLLLFALVASPFILPENRHIVIASMLLGLVTLTLLIYAGVRGSRWWFAVPVIYILFSLFIMSRGD
jgi:hypothetical protein